MVDLLVPMDENAETIDRLATGVADLPFEPDDTRVTVLNVFEEFEVTSGEWSAIDSEEFYDEELPDVVAAAANRISEDGFTVDVRREHGDPAELILEVARELDVDAIAMTGRSRSPVGKVLFGSVTQAVLLDADRPVVVIPATADT